MHKLYAHIRKGLLKFEWIIDMEVKIKDRKFLSNFFHYALAMVF